jgi:AcrR family transcriptional regulator
MSSHPLLPIVGEPRPERSDAARNRAALLDAATRLVEQRGIRSVTMEAVATEARVGKGTVFRRFHSREGLMAALLDRSEADWQAQVMGGPPPLGPGAPPMERLLAFGHSRIEVNLKHAELIRAAGRAGARSYAAYSFVATHTRYLLGQLGVRGDVELLAIALMAPIESSILEQQVTIERVDLGRIRSGWADLARRIVENPVVEGER